MANKRYIKRLITSLQLLPHLEGGFFREVFRSQQKVELNNKKYSAITDIYFLLLKGQVSRFHKITRDEIWHFYEGAPLELFQIDPKTLAMSKVLLSSAGYKHLVTKGSWQAARTKGEYSLVGCTVAPGFEFQDLKFLRDDQKTCRTIMKKYPKLVSFF